jgi:tetraacyldisaccharide 4'-kinase
LINKTYFEDLLYGRRTSPVWTILLYVFSVVYRAVIVLRWMLFRLHLFKRKKISCPVISIGNITLGGTGKTPTVIQVAGLLFRNKRLPVVVSRGYGRKDETEILVVSDGRSILVDTHTGGDEPVLIASKLPGIPVVVGQNRYQAAMHALLRFGPGVVVLDDGFQHVRLRRDLDIVLLDAGNPFGNGKLFPAGILREPLCALKRAHAVLITKMDDAGSVTALKETIQRNTNARIFTALRVPVDLVDYHSNAIKPLSALRGSKVLALSGIAQPALFTLLLKSLGAEVIAAITYPDHYDYQKSDLAAVYQKAATNEKISMIVTTEKDAIRLKDLHAEGIWALRVELTVVESDAWETFILEGIGHA